MMAIEHEALKRFIEATSKFEARFGSAIVGQPMALCETGEKYTEHLNGHASGHYDLKEAFATADAATEATFSRLEKLYPPNANATLYWRVKPEIDYSGHCGGYRTYCRFIVSEKKAN